MANDNDSPWVRRTNSVSDYIPSNTHSAELPMEGDLIDRLGPAQVDDRGEIVLRTVYDGRNVIATYNRHYDTDALSYKKVVPGYIEFNSTGSKGKNARRKSTVTDVVVLNKQTKHYESTLKAIRKNIDSVEKRIHNLKNKLGVAKSNLQKLKAKSKSQVINLGKITKKSKLNKLVAGLTTDNTTYKAQVKVHGKWVTVKGTSYKELQQAIKKLQNIKAGQFIAEVTCSTSGAKSKVAEEMLEAEIAHLTQDIKDLQNDRTKLNKTIIAVNKEWRGLPTPTRTKNAEVYGYEFKNSWFRTYKLRDNVYGKDFQLYYAYRKFIKDPAADFLQKQNGVPKETKLAHLRPMADPIYSQLHYPDAFKRDGEWVTWNKEKTCVIQVNNGRFTHGAFDLIIPSLNEDVPIKHCSVTPFDTCSDMVVDLPDGRIKVIVNVTTSRNVRVSVRNPGDIEFTVRYVISARSKS